MCIDGCVHISPLSPGSPVRLQSRCGEGCVVEQRGICLRGATASCLLPAQTVEDCVLPLNSAKEGLNLKSSFAYDLLRE